MDEADEQVHETPEDDSNEELDLFSQLQNASQAQDEEDDSEEGVSLEELSQSYAKLAPETTSDENELEVLDCEDEEPSEEEDTDAIVSPRSIVESILFVGGPDNAAITAAQIAKTMRGVTDSDVREIIDELNSIYEQSERAMQIVEQPDGYRVELAPDLEFIRDRFYGRTREISLNQAAIDCLALIAYQPGISRDELEKQRGQPSGGILNQLVRRQLIEMHRADSGKKKKVPHYHPTEKLLELAGLATLEDLPQVVEMDID